MTGSYAPSFENRRQGRIFLLVLALHAVALYGLLLQKRTVRQTGAESHIDLIWIKPPTPKAAGPAPAIAPPMPGKQAATLPKTNAAPAVTPQEKKHAVPDTPVPAEDTGKKPLDMQKILAEVGPAIRKLDSEQPGGHAASAQPGQPSFEAKLGQVLANATPNPKFYEPPKIEMISSGAQLDGGTIMYKITTFAGAYCVTYQDGVQTFVGTCPIKF